MFLLKFYQHCYSSHLGCQASFSNNIKNITKEKYMNTKTKNNSKAINFNKINDTFLINDNTFLAL